MRIIIRIKKKCSKSNLKDKNKYLNVMISKPKKTENENNVGFFFGKDDDF